MTALGSVSTAASQCTLNNSINASVLSIPVSAANAAETSSLGWRDDWTGAYVVKVDNELILISTSSPSTLTVAPVSVGLPIGGRGYLGTTPSSHSSGAKAFFTYVVNRSGSDIEVAEEAQISTDSGVPGYTYGCHRIYAGAGSGMSASLPVGPTSEIGLDHAADRLPLVSFKAVSGATWRQMADATSGATYNTIVARGNEVANYQSLYGGLGRHGATFCVALHHEMNLHETEVVTTGSATPAVSQDSWRDMYENVFTIWENDCGVVMWEGDLSGNTITEGLIIGPCWAWQADSQAFTVGDDYWPASWTWGNDHLQLAADDAYNRGPNWRRFARCLGASGIPSQNLGFKSWADAKKVTQNVAGKPLLMGIWETACGEGKVGSASFPSTSQYTQVGVDWSTGSSPTSGLDANKTNWLADARNFCRDSWTDLNHLALFDSQVNSITEWQVDTTQEAWDAWVSFATDPIFDQDVTVTSSTKTFVIG